MLIVLLLIAAPISIIFLQPPFGVICACCCIIGIFLHESLLEGDGESPFDVFKRLTQERIDQRKSGR